MKNYGINLEKQKRDELATDWRFGASSIKCIAQIPKDERVKYLPKGELQFGFEDFMDCATRGLLNIIESKLNYLLKTKQLPHEQWFRDNGYITENGFELSDRFNAILSGTTRDGNSMKAPLDSIRKDGVIPKRMLPARSNMTFDEYMDRSQITGSMLALGKNFLRHLSVYYETVKVSEFDKVDDFLDVVGHAWDEPVNGKYRKSDGPFNHVFVNIHPKYKAFDNYIDSVDGDFIKDLEPDFKFYDVGYRIILSVTPQEQYTNILFKLVDFLKNYVSFLSKNFGSAIKFIISRGGGY